MSPEIALISYPYVIGGIRSYNVMFDEILSAIQVSLHFSSFLFGFFLFLNTKIFILDEC